MHAVQSVPEKENLAELVSELIHMNPPASIENLIQAVTYIWTSPEALHIIEAISRREDVTVEHYKTLLERRSNCGQNSVRVGSLIIGDLQCSIQNLMFVFGKVPSLRRRIATLVANHGDANVCQLKQVASCDDLEEGIAELIGEKVKAMDTSNVRELLQRIERAY